VELVYNWPYLFVSLVPIILFAPFLLGLRVMYWGTPLFQFYPWQQFALDTIRAGHLPLWNPYLGNGAPLIANYQSAVFYPPNWLMLLIPHDYAMGLLVTLHLIWAGVGMVTLARALGLRPLGQAVAGLAFGLSQYLVARVGFFSINAAAAWLPWVILAGDRLVTSNFQFPTSNFRPLLFNLLPLSFCLSLQLLSGHAQSTWYTLLLLGAWTLWRTTQSSNPPILQSPLLPRAQAKRAPLLIFAAILLAFTLAALQLLPTAELLRQSPRATAADYEFVMTYSFSPWRLLTLLAPDLLGNPALGRFYGYGNYWEDAIYIGLLPCLLALGVILRALRHFFTPASRHPITQSPHSSITYFLTLLLPLCLALALGRNTPLFPFFYKYIPTFNLFQAPTRLMLLFVFALALLAGLGADEWKPPPGRALYWTRLGAAGAVSIILIGALAYLFLPATGKLAQQLHTVARAVTLCGIGIFISSILALLSPAPEGSERPRSPATLWQLALLSFIAIDLILANYPLTPGASPDLYRVPASSSAALQATLGGHRLFQFPDDEYRVKYGHYLSFFNFGSPDYAPATRSEQFANLNLLDGLASANNFDPLLSARYVDYLAIVSATRSLNLLRLMDVGAIASSEPLPFEIIAKGSATTFYRVPGAPRRVRTVYLTRSVPDAPTARAVLLDPNFAPDTEVILEASDPGSSTRPYPYTLFSPFPSSPNAFTITVTLDRLGWVVLSDTYYPDWYAFIDNQPAPILHADYAFRAVAVEAGTHTLTFLYQPRSFQLGLAISAISWVIFIILFYLLRHRPKPLPASDL
jgi:hypothetical protein